jgi:hypothetical protein
MVHTVETLLERATPEPNTGCWLWTKAIAGVTGYPVTHHRGVAVGAHRLMAALVFGPLSPGMDACHRCDVRSCINPDHLFVGTHAENMADMHAKGRANTVKGERKPGAKLNDRVVSEIKAALASGTHPNSLAAKYGVTPPVIYNIRAGRNWKHIKEAA